MNNLINNVNNSAVYIYLLYLSPFTVRIPKTHHTQCYFASCNYTACDYKDKKRLITVTLSRRLALDKYLVFSEQNYSSDL